MSSGLNNPIAPSARVERRFFGIVRWCGLIAATAALVAALIAGVGGGSKLLNQPNTQVQPPTTSYEDFRRTAVGSRQDNQPANIDTTMKEKEAAAARAAADAEFEKQLKPHLDAIVASLSSYAAKTGQPKPSAQGVGDFVRQSMREVGRYGSDLSWKYAEGLSTAARDLASDGDRLAKLETTDSGRVRYDAFLEWYTRAYIQQIRAELQRIDADKIRALSNIAEAPMYFYVAAIAFAIFVLGTMLLVLLRIELNTRAAG